MRLCWHNKNEMESKLIGCFNRIEEKLVSMYNVAQDVNGKINDDPADNLPKCFDDGNPNCYCNHQ